MINNNELTGKKERKKERNKMSNIKEEINKVSRGKGYWQIHVNNSFSYILKLFNYNTSYTIFKKIYAS